MRRGRWVVCLCAFFLFFISPRASYGIPLSVTATVPLSSLWKESLRFNSEAKIDISHAHILLISQQSLGIEKLPVEQQKIQLLLFKDKLMVTQQEKVTDKTGVVDFVFISEQPGTYSLIVVNKSDITPFVVKSALVSF